MRKLHLVGLTTDRDGLIFTARKGSKSGGFIVPLDEKLLAAIVQAGDQANGARAEAAVAVADVAAVPKRRRSESALTPREMQARLRSGRSIEEVAAEAGVDTEWVSRFAVPIAAEQAQVVELARALVYAKPRLGDSTEPLGASVLQNLSDRGVFLPDDMAHAGWSAFQIHDAVWMVRFRYRARGKDQEAQWEIDVPAGRLRARNRHASDLGYVGPDRWAAAEPEDLPNGDEPVVAPRRRARPAPARPEPMAQAVARAKRSAAALPAPVAPVPKSRAAARRPAATRAATTKAVKSGTAKAPAPKAATKGATRAAPVKRRPAKAAPAPDVGPTAGSGGVRMAVARVSTARVAASMATADRAPWAAAVRRPTRAGAGNGAQPTEPRRPVAPEPARSRRPPEPVEGRAFQPRPLPPPGQEPQPPRVRKVTVPAPRRTADDGAPAVSLPAKRPPLPRAEPLPGDRAKRRRMRSR